MKTKPISDETRTAILNATWSLIAKKKRLDVGQAEIAQAAGVSRQTIYLAFGSRAGLLTAMVRNKDLQSDHVARLGQLSRDAATPEDLERYLDVWLEYLAVIYPVAILLDAAALTDAEAAAAWDDRMKGALLAGFKSMVKRLGKRGASAERLAEEIWSLVHPSAWRQLVIDCAWTPQEFRKSRLDLIRARIVGA